MPYDMITAERVRDVLSGRSDVVEKRLMGGLCFMVSGNMCCSVSARGGLLIRVVEETRGELLEKPHVSPMQMGDRAVKSFIRVAPDGYRTDAGLRKWIHRALEAVAALPAKTARRKTQARTAKPRTAKPRTAKPKTAKPKTAKPKTAKPKTAKPKTAKLKTAQSRRAK